ncbi:hypothetical protein DID88_006985 [Monilinia fructigena]|uniref:Uncharacterized protein n=1 Tax=Monilinia fructigena TaxID=38457 RepID=A0A395IGI3_9HELO|nr:hypothetical protein DID88_006985 [Monilinia fructigena]
MNEAADVLASIMLNGHDDVQYQRYNSSEENVDNMDVDDDPKLILQDTIIYQRNGSIANLFDTAAGLKLRAEGTLWVENAERYKLKRPNAHFTDMVESAELKHFITDYYERVSDNEAKDDLLDLCWEYAREDGRGLLHDEVIEVLTKDANAFFLLTAFREEIWVDAKVQDMKWSRTAIYKLLKKECPNAFKRANTNLSSEPEPMIIDPPIIPDLPPVIGDGFPIKVIRGAGPRIAKCLVYKIGGLIADLLEERQPHLFKGSKLVDELREIARTPYPPYTKQVTSDVQWQEYMDKAEGLYLVRRNLHHSEKSGAFSTNGSTKFQVKDIFTGELAPHRSIGRSGTGRVGRPPKNRDYEAGVYYGDEEDQAETSSGVEAEIPLTAESVWQHVWDLGGEEEIIGGRVIPARIRRAGY